MQGKNDIKELRGHLFATLEALRDKKDPMDIERAEAIANVSKQIIESAKVEVAMVRTLALDAGHFKGTGFIPTGKMELTDGTEKLLNGK